jgi:aryl-alcohol dehydrogenase-like predicted oxidoreductase
MIQYRSLGNTDLQVAPIAFGCNVFGWTLDEQQAFRMLDALVDAGFNFLDTADTYSTWVPGNKGGESETIIGNWLRKSGKRSQIVLATKLGGDMGSGKRDLSARYMEQASGASLRRLGTDYIDLYQSHYDDADTPVSETMTAFNELIRAGKVRHIGASNLSAERIAASNEFARQNSLSPYISIQPLYNLCERRKFETEYLPLVQQEQLAVLSYYALASGFLSGKYRSEADLDKSPRGQGVRKYLNEAGMRILSALDQVAADLKATPAQVSIAWLLHKPFITAPIASATSLEQLQDLVRAASLELSPAHMDLLDGVSEVKEV